MNITESNLIVCSIVLLSFFSIMGYLLNELIRRKCFKKNDDYNLIKKQIHDMNNANLNLACKIASIRENLNIIFDKFENVESHIFDLDRSYKDRFTDINKSISDLSYRINESYGHIQSLKELVNEERLEEIDNLINRLNLFYNDLLSDVEILKRSGHEKHLEEIDESIDKLEEMIEDCEQKFMNLEKGISLIESFKRLD